MTITLSPSLSVPHPSPFSLTPTTTLRQLFFTNFTPSPRRRLQLQARAGKPNVLIPINPSVAVEKGKYSYDVETLINRITALQGPEDLLTIFIGAEIRVEHHALVQ